MSVMLVRECRMFSRPDLTRNRKSSVVSRSSVHAQMIERARREKLGMSAKRYWAGSASGTEDTDDVGDCSGDGSPDPAIQDRTIRCRDQGVAQTSHASSA